MSSTSTGIATADAQSPASSGIQRIDDTHFRIDRQTFDRTLADNELLIRAARVVPVKDQGKPGGIKLFGIRPRRLLDKLGLVNGDHLHQVAEHTIDTPEQLLELRPQLRGKSNFSIGLTRRGQPLILHYTIVDDGG